MTEEEASEKQEEEAGQIVTNFMEQLDVDEDVAVVLLEEVSQRWKKCLRAVG